ncbi:predicted protein [Nematostella vectensis]|uniref:G-protein coupled receptors family 1 profile domain-containing protein n=1 Tax=Nematostella vectensis TaxID=45351 RepID=A7SAY7_NEMVE|nr:melatonin receptor type 1B-A [Nematostella vectensis]EDO39161.1 predicted protein [Nematostella vectensis]|eukprot:XP_001631224.1 predicted protein [Nematostella vectensis]
MVPNSSFILQQMQRELASRGTAKVVAESGTFFLFMVIVLFGNSLTLYIVLSNRRLRTVPNLFVVSLALSDLGMGVLSMPMCITVLSVSGWPFGDSACQYNGFIAVTMGVSSTQTLALTSVNRYFKVVKPSLYRKYFTMRATIICILSSWFLATLATIPYLASGSRMIFHPGKYVCYLHINAGWYVAFVATIYVGLPSSVIMFCYFHVFKAVKAHQKRFQNTNNNSNVSVEEIKITRTLFVVVVCFMFCWSPILIIDLVDTFRGFWSMNRETYTMWSFLAIVSSAVNPIIYGFFNPSFRREYLKILLCKRGRSEEGVARITVKSANSTAPSNATTATRLR